MRSIAVAFLANLVGLAAAVLVLTLLGLADGGWRVILRTRRGLGLLSILAAGGLLAASGQYMIIHRFDVSAIDAELQVALGEPLEAFTLQVQGPDPFRARPDACALRLIITSKTGQELISELPRSRLTLDIGKGVPGPAGGATREYTFAWRSVIDGVRNEQGRELAARIDILNDWRRLDRVVAEIVARAPGRVPMPDFLRISVVADPPVEVFSAPRIPKRPNCTATPGSACIGTCFRWRTDSQAGRRWRPTGLRGWGWAESRRGC